MLAETERKRQEALQAAMYVSTLRQQLLQEQIQSGIAQRMMANEAEQHKKDVLERDQIINRLQQVNPIHHDSFAMSAKPKTIHNRYPTNAHLAPSSTLWCLDMPSS
jgi:hypothetical protein